MLCGKTAWPTGRPSHARSYPGRTAKFACSGARARRELSSVPPSTSRRSCSWPAPSCRGGPALRACHGTAGNGYAFLKAFARTGDERWLKRARRFAVHALHQVSRLREERGRGRYSLWTGDVGVAVYAADCIEARSEYPIFDYC